MTTTDPELGKGAGAHAPSLDTGAVHLKLDKPGQWVIQEHFPNLIFAIPKPKNLSLHEKFGDDRHFRISFAELQRMHLRKLQCKLVKHVVAMRYSGEPDDWENDLQRYVEAMQNYDYMKSCTQRPRDPFYVTAERRVDNEVMQTAMGTIAVHEHDLKEVDATEKWDAKRNPIGGTRKDTLRSTWWEQFYERVGMAALGGAFLIGPMWLMVLHNTLYTGLISTTAFVTAFGLIMAWFLEQNMDVLSTTAAYAAVLVVFVGLNTSS